MSKYKCKWKAQMPQTFQVMSIRERSKEELKLARAFLAV